MTATVANISTARALSICDAAYNYTNIFDWTPGDRDALDAACRRFNFVCPIERGPERTWMTDKWLGPEGVGYDNILEAARRWVEWEARQ